MSIKTMETMCLVALRMMYLCAIGCMLGMMGLTMIATICIILGFISMVTSVILGIRIFKYYESH